MSGINVNVVLVNVSNIGFIFKKKEPSICYQYLKKITLTLIKAWSLREGSFFNRIKTDLNHKHLAENICPSMLHSVGNVKDCLIFGLRELIDESSAPLWTKAVVTPAPAVVKMHWQQRVRLFWK